MSGGAIAEAIIGLLKGLTDSGIAIDQNTRNIHAQRNALHFNKLMYLVSMLREDTAVQRRVKDLRAAGLSPTLAAGSAATTMAPLKADPIKTNLNMDLQNRFQNAMQLRNQVELMNAQTSNINESTQKIAQNRQLDLLKFPDQLENLKRKNILTAQQTDNLKQKLKDAVLQYKYSSATHYKMGTPGLLASPIRDIYNLMEKEARKKYGGDTNQY